jgi:hypothetical protein
MEDMFIREDGVACDAVEECLEHASAARDHGRIVLGAPLLGRIVTNALLGGDGWDNERGVELREAGAQRLELGIPVPRRGVLGICEKDNEAGI